MCIRDRTWASGIDASGRPILTPDNDTKPGNTITCPAVRGATNWYSPAYSPRTNLFYFMAVEDCGSYRQAKQGGFGFLNNPRDPGLKYIRALDIETGKTAWEIQQIGPCLLYTSLRIPPSLRKRGQDRSTVRDLHFSPSGWALFSLYATRGRRTTGLAAV